MKLSSEQGLPWTACQWNLFWQHPIFWLLAQHVLLTHSCLVNTAMTGIWLTLMAFANQTFFQPYNLVVAVTLSQHWASLSSKIIVWWLVTQCNNYWDNGFKNRTNMKVHFTSSTMQTDTNNIWDLLYIITMDVPIFYNCNTRRILCPKNSTATMLLTLSHFFVLSRAKA